MFRQRRGRPVRSPRGFGPWLEQVEGRILLSGNTYTVTSLSYFGGGSGLSGDSRYAITPADTVPGSTIKFAVTGTIQLTSQLPLITANMTIDGPGAASLSVKGGGASSDFPVMVVKPGVTAKISGLTITGGNVSKSGDDPYTDGGGIVNYGTLTLTNSTVSGNSANCDGGIYNSSNGKLSVTGCAISGNSAYYSGGWIGTRGGDPK